MDKGFLIQTGASLVAILVLAALAAWAKIARPATDLDTAGALALFAAEFPDRAIGAVWLAADKRAAVARSGDLALVIYRAGDGYVARSLPLADLARAKVAKGKVALRLGDVAAPLARMALGADTAWPPMELAQ